MFLFGLQVVGNKEFKSPVTAVDAVDGHLIGCVSQKVECMEM